jgi:mycothiol synthase
VADRLCAPTDSDPSVITALFADGRPVGAEAARAGRPGTGWVESLAVRREWRRRGVGKALLLRAFRALCGRGWTFAGLTVDATNPTGAVRLYESVGMRSANRRLTYEKQLS